MNKFTIGEKVRKVDGYKFPGVVRSCFEKLNGDVRYAVECTAPEAEGMLHLFNGSQLESIESSESLPTMETLYWRGTLVARYTLTPNISLVANLVWCLPAYYANPFVNWTWPTEVAMRRDVERWCRENLDRKSVPASTDSEWKELRFFGRLVAKYRYSEVDDPGFQWCLEDVTDPFPDQVWFSEDKMRADVVAWCEKHLTADCGSA